MRIIKVSDQARRQAWKTYNEAVSPAREVRDVRQILEAFSQAIRPAEKACAEAFRKAKEIENA